MGAARHGVRGQRADYQKACVYRVLHGSAPHSWCMSGAEAPELFLERLYVTWLGVWTWQMIT